MELRDFAIAIEHGQSEGRIIGKGKRNYTLWEYDAVGFKIYYKFVKVLSSSRMVVEEGWPNIFICDTLGSDWHTQAALTRSINDIRVEIRAKEQEAKGIIPFGKHKGKQVQDCDLSYLCWLANQSTKEESSDGLDCWIRDSARIWASRKGALIIGGCYIDPDGENRFDKNTVLLYRDIQKKMPIQYFAEQNDGSIWSAYQIILPTREVGHPYYGTCKCLLVDGAPRKAKGLLITILDYEVEQATIQVKKFVVAKV
jgi:hypothetical protein